MIRSSLEICVPAAKQSSVLYAVHPVTQPAGKTIILFKKIYKLFLTHISIKAPHIRMAQC